LTGPGLGRDGCQVIGTGNDVKKAGQEAGEEYAHGAVTFRKQ
jgi:hypothetical protein